MSGSLENVLSYTLKFEMLLNKKINVQIKLMSTLYSFFESNKKTAEIFKLFEYNFFTS